MPSLSSYINVSDEGEKNTNNRHHFTSKKYKKKKTEKKLEESIEVKLCALVFGATKTGSINQPVNQSIPIYTINEPITTIITTNTTADKWRKSKRKKKSGQTTNRSS